MDKANSEFFLISYKDGDDYEEMRWLCLEGEKE